MAARKNPYPDQNTIERIRATVDTGLLIKRLTSFIKGEVKLEGPQVTAALGLLKKTLPDLTAVEHSGEVEHAYAARLPTASKTMDEWQKSHADNLSPSKTLQ